MPIQIKIEHRGGSIENLRQRYYLILNRLSKPDVSRSVKKVAEIWAVNYRSEGKQVGGWAQLAQQTVADRAKRGYGGEHPIMIRQGSLYAMSTLFFMKGQQGSASATTRSSGNSVTTRANLSMANGVAILALRGPLVKHQFGDKGANLPARQYWFTNRSVIMAARLGVLEWIKDEVVK